MHAPKRRIHSRDGVALFRFSEVPVIPQDGLISADKATKVVKRGLILMLDFVLQTPKSSHLEHSSPSSDNASAGI